MKFKSHRVLEKRWTGILWGASTSIVVTILLCFILTAMIHKEKLEENNVGYGVLAIVILASFTGAYTACRCIGKQRLAIGLLTGATYLCMLMIITATAFGAKYSGIGETVLLILCGNILAAMWTSRKKSAGKKRKLKIGNG